MKNIDKIKVVGYCRVSSQEQANKGISLEAQKEKIKQWAALHDAEIIGLYEDAGISGTKSNRPGLQSALKIACENKAVFVVYSLSRFSRSTTDTLRFTAQLQKSSADLVSVSEQIDTLSAAGKMVFRILSVLNEFESDLAGERTKAVMDFRKSKGLKSGGFVPYGYSADKIGKLKPDPKEQEIIKQIKESKENGMKYAEIARFLNDKNIPTKTGKQWQIQTVKNIVLGSIELTLNK